MSYENSGIPLVVRYNNRGEPDGLKEELNIRVTSIEADTYLGGDLGISALSAVQDLSLSSPLRDGDVITWSSIDGTTGRWTNQPGGGGGGTPGSIAFTDLTDTPGQYEVGTPPANTPNDAILRVSPTSPQITFSQYGESDLTGPITLHEDFVDLSPGETLIRSDGAPEQFLGRAFEFLRLYDVNIAAPGAAEDDLLVKLNWTGSQIQLVLATHTDADIFTISDFDTRIQTVVELNDISDVNAKSPGLNQVLTWNGNAWVPAASTGTGATTFVGLNDTIPDLTGFADGIVYVSSDGGVNYKVAITDPTGPETDDPVVNIRTVSAVNTAVTSLSNNEVLFKDPTTGLGGLTFSLENLTDVDFDTTVTSTTDHIIKWDGAAFTNQEYNFRLLKDTPNAYGSTANSKKFLVLNGDESTPPDQVVFSNFTETTISTIQSDISTINNTTIPAIYASATTVSGALDTLAGRVGINENDISQNISDIGALEAYFNALSNGDVITKTGGTVTTTPFKLQNLNDTTSTAPNNAYTDQFLKWDPTANGGLGQWRIIRVAGFYTTGSAGDIQEGRVNASGLGGDGLPEGFLKITPITSSVTTVNKISVSGDLNAEGLTPGYSLIVGPSGTVTAISTAPLADQEGKLRLINASSTAETNSENLIWDYVTSRLNVSGDVSAHNFYGTFAGASGIITNLSGVSSIQFATDMPAGYTAVEGEVYYDTDAHTLSIQTGANTTLQVGQEQVIRVRNDSGEQLVDGTVVYVSGTQGVGVAKLLIGKADASVSEEEQDIIGIVTETIDNNSDGFITTFGLVRDVNTSGFAAGTLLYLGETPGTFTDTAPSTGFHAIRLGVVLREHQTDGVIFAKIDLGYDLENLHDVNISGIQSGDILRWNGTELIPSAFDHGQMAGLSDDDHSQYVFKSPTGSSRNTIQPGSDVPALTLQEGLSQTEPLLVVKDALTTTTLTVDGDGNIDTTGKLTAQSKSFLIDHPTKEGMKLQYTCLEGPENGAYCRGRVKTNVIILPDYWVGLVDEDSITVNLTPAGKKQPNLFVEDIRDNKIFLSSSESIDCFYTVFGERKDIDKLIVEF